MLGSDAVTLTAHTIPSGETRSIPIDLHHIRSTSPKEVYHSNGSLSFSTRSRLAQYGGEFLKKFRSHLSYALSHPDNLASTSIPFTNYSAAPILIEPGDVFKVMKKQGPPLTGSDLLDHIESGEIEIGGQEGTDWWLAKDKYQVAIGVGMFVRQPETWIPQRDTPLCIQGGTTQTFREELAKYLQPVLPEDPAHITISETHRPLYTSEHLIAFLDQHTTAVAPEGVRIANEGQINAPALYGGYPRNPWPIRTELRRAPEQRQSTNNGLHRTAVIATFYPVLNPAF